MPSDTEQSENQERKLSSPLHPTRWKVVDDNGVLHSDAYRVPLETTEPTHFRVFDPFQSDLDKPLAIDNIFPVIAATRQHTYQLLTTRPERAGRMPWPRPNLWLGVLIENQQQANERLPHLIATDAAVRFVVCKPGLEHIDLTRAIGPWPNGWACPRCGFNLTKMMFRAEDGAVGIDVSTAREVCPNDGVTLVPAKSCIDWVIVMGSKDPEADPLNPNSVRLLRDQCEKAQVPFCFAGWGPWIGWEHNWGPYWISGRGDETDGHRFPDMNESPEPDGWREGWFEEQNDAYGVLFERVGTTAAGRLLDGKRWEQYPGQPVAAEEKSEEATA